MICAGSKIHQHEAGSQRGHHHPFDLAIGRAGSADSHPITSTTCYRDIVLRCVTII